MAANEPEVRRNEASHRYETVVEGHTALLQYRESPGVIDLLHTEVPEALEGRGVGGLLARTALEDARARGLRVIPSCPFVAAYLRRHPEYQSLVHSGHAGRPE